MIKTHAYKGKLITFEGSEGSGKSTQISILKSYLEALGKTVVFVREPGGVAISENIRKILLDVNNTNMTDECEMLLYMAARSQLVREVIYPALKVGKIVLCDRYLDSTVAYQGFGSGVDIAIIEKVGAFATFGITPDLTFIFDIDVKTGFSRIKRKKDRIENRQLAYHNKVRNGYQVIALKEKKRVKLIDAKKPIKEIQALVRKQTDSLFKVKK